MAKRLLLVLGLVAFIFSISGCATARKQKDMELQGLKNQVSVLEAQIQTKDEEISTLKESLDKAVQEKESVAAVKTIKKKIIGEVKSRPNVKQTQTALFNAGYDPGTIDGRMGRQTRDVIKSFQKANNLIADGKVGRKTWQLLSPYLYKKIK